MFKLKSVPLYCLTSVDHTTARFPSGLYFGFMFPHSIRSARQRVLVFYVRSLPSFVALIRGQTAIWKKLMGHESTEYAKQLQYIHLIPVPVGRTSASGWLYQSIWMTRQKISHAHQWHTWLGNQSYVQLQVHPYIQAQEIGWQSGVRSCIMPGLPMHLVKE